MSEIVFPKNNEDEFIEVAYQLGIKDLVFVYPLKDFKKHSKFKTGIIVESVKEAEKAYRLSSFVIAKSNEELDRGSLEKSKIKLVFDFESSFKQDFLHSRRSGLNHIMTRIAKEKNKIIGFDFGSALNSPNRSSVMGRMMQNIKLCRKAKCDIVISSFARSPLELRSKHDLEAFFICMGMHASEAKAASDILNNVVT